MVAISILHIVLYTLFTMNRDFKAYKLVFHFNTFGIYSTNLSELWWQWNFRILSDNLSFSNKFSIFGLFSKMQQLFTWCGVWTAALYVFIYVSQMPLGSAILNFHVPHHINSRFIFLSDTSSFAEILYSFIQGACSDRQHSEISSNPSFWGDNCWSCYY